MFDATPCFESNIAKSITYIAKSDDYTSLKSEKNCFAGKQFLSESIIEKIVFRGCQVLIAKAAKHCFTPAELIIEKIVFLRGEVLIQKVDSKFLKKNFSMGFWKVIDN